MHKNERKNRVTEIRSYLSAIGSPISQAQGYEVLARAEGLANANTLAGISSTSSVEGSTLPPFSQRSEDAHASAVALLAAKYGLSDVICQHAMQSLDVTYEQESVAPLVNGRELRFPAFPAECDYVRVVCDGYELMYWNSDEWGDDPTCVMGAFMGLARG